MPAPSPAQPPEAGAASQAPPVLRATSRPPARQSNPHDIHAAIPRGTRSWELGRPVDFGPSPEIPGGPSLPPPTPEIRPRQGLLGTHPSNPEDFSLPADAPTPRPPPRDHPFDALDDALTSQGLARRSSQPVAYRGFPTPQDDFEEGSSREPGRSAGASGSGEDEVMGHSDSGSPRHATQRQDSVSGFGGGSGRRDERQRSLSDMSTDEPEPVEPSGQQPAPARSLTRAAQADTNRTRYPAYDASGRRIGLEHTQLAQSPPQGGGRSYYRPRTHNYPGPNVKTVDLPHVMSLDMRISPTAIAPSGPAESMFLRSNVRPNTLHPSTLLQGQSNAPSPPTRNPSPPPPPPPNPPIRDPTGLTRPVGPQAPTQSQVRPRAQSQLHTPTQASSTLSPSISVNSTSDTQSQRASEPPLSPSPAPELTPVEASSRNPRVPDFEVETPEIPDAGPALRELLGLGEGEEISLNTLEDPPDGERPGWSYPTLIKLAIYGSPSKRLTLQEIYTAIENRFKWYKDSTDKAWQGSIRHNLSLNKCFRLVQRPISEPGKGHFWVVDYSQGEGNKRQRKRNKKKTKAELRRLAEAESTRQRGDISESSEEPEERPQAQGAEATPATRTSQSSSALAARTSAATRPPQASRSPQEPFAATAAMPPPPPPASITRPMSAPRGGLPPELWSRKNDRGSLMHLVNTPYVGSAPMPPGTSVPSSSRDSPSSIAAQLDDAHIDPLLRDTALEGGHVVGEGRAPPNSRAPRVRGHSPYLSPARFGPVAIPPHPGHPAPSPRMNWAPYGAPPPLPHTQQPMRSVMAGNMLGLSGSTPGAGPSSATFSIPGPDDPPPAQPPESNVREQPEDRPPEGVRRSARVRAAKRTDYRDSRGSVYASAGREPVSSESEDEG